MPDPDEPIRTEISPRATVREALATPMTTPVFSEISVRVPPASSAASACCMAAAAADGFARGANRISTVRNSSGALMTHASCPPDG